MKDVMLLYGEPDCGPQWMTYLQSTILLARQRPPFIYFKKRVGILSPLLKANFHRSCPTFHTFLVVAKSRCHICTIPPSKFSERSLMVHCKLPDPIHYIFILITHRPIVLPLSYGICWYLCYSLNTVQLTFNNNLMKAGG